MMMENYLVGEKVRSGTDAKQSEIQKSLRIGAKIVNIYV